MKITVERIVAAFEADAENGGYDDGNLEDGLTVGEVRALIADWRKRGERIAELELEVVEAYNRGVEDNY